MSLALCPFRLFNMWTEPLVVNEAVDPSVLIQSFFLCVCVGMYS